MSNPQTVDSADLSKNIRETSEHTAKVMDNLLSFLFNPAAFNSAHKVDISSIPVGGPERKDLPLLAFIHDFYKIRDSRDHAVLGADFIEQRVNTSLLRFHAVFGVANTGEASLLFLDELAQFVENLADDAKRQEFLDKLLILTIVDVASYGYLNQARVNAFNYFISLVRQVPGERELEKMALQNTESRLQRLIEANNRVSVASDVIHDCFSRYPESEELKQLLLFARFEMGAYSFEPLIRSLLRPGDEYLIQDTTQITVTRDCEPVIRCFFDSLLETLRGQTPQVRAKDACVGRRLLKVYDMTALSIKANEHLDQFAAWSRRFREKMKGK